MSFGARLAQIRKDKGLTQTDLGKGLGTDGQDASKSVVYGWEKDQHYPRVDQLVLICERLKCSADYLLFGKALASALTPEVAELAAQIDALPPEQRAGAIKVIRTIVEVTTNPSGEEEVSPSDEPQRFVRKG